mmetsp:Transcript_17061/g.53542  ORF Transcript_17061/g.53542 Transcript_17061/m.53542 type:complete len:317 (-) Transcript_17061:29-979(-)
MEFRRTRGAFCSFRRRVASGLLLAFCAVAAMMMDSTTFLGAMAGRPGARALQLHGAAIEGQLVASAGGRSANPSSSMAAASWLHVLPAAVCAGAFLAARRTPTPRRSRHVCRLFGGGRDKKEKAKEEATEEAAEEPNEEVEEELSEAAEEACAKLREEIEELKVHADGKRMAHERLKLEVENFRTRTRQELAAARGQAAVPLIKELLPIADEFDLAKQNLKIEGDAQQAVADRFAKLFDKMMGVWKGLGVEKLEAVGQPFNPELHEAVSMIPSADYGPEVVCNELRGGWVLKTPGSDDPQVLRPSLVCVSSGPGPS